MTESTGSRPPLPYVLGLSEEEIAAVSTIIKESEGELVPFSEVIGILELALVHMNDTPDKTRTEIVYEVLNDQHRQLMRGIAYRCFAAGRTTLKERATE